MKDLYILGVTGSIGLQALEVIDTEEFEIVAISAGKNISKLQEIIVKYKPKFVSVELEEDCIYLQNKHPNILFSWGRKGLVEVATYGKEGGYLLNALVGMIGLEPTLSAIEHNRTILLANKETLVVGGELVISLAKEKNVQIIPIDSEHSAIFQCLAQSPLEEVRQVIITASGGSFRDYSREDLKNVSIKDALNHPNWKMGKKITIDSATMVNKGLEVIEAHYLFNLPYDKITTIIHPESIIHSMVEFVDGSIIAQLSEPNMRLAITYALTYPHKKENNHIAKLDFAKLKNLSFKEMSYERYPALGLAYEVGKAGGILPAVYNASNEEAVALFLEGKISFLDIEKIIFSSLKNTINIMKPSLEDLLEASSTIRERIRNKYLS